MAILEKDRIEQEKSDKVNQKQQLEAEVDEGRRAERLSVNQDFKWFLELSTAPIVAWDSGKMEFYDSLLSQTSTRDQEDAAVKKIKEMNVACESVRNVFKLLTFKTERGRQASEELKKLQGEI